MDPSVDKSIKWRVLVHTYIAFYAIVRPQMRMLNRYFTFKIGTTNFLKK